MAKRLVITKDADPFDWSSVPESVLNDFFRATLDAARRYYGITPERDQVAKIYKGEGEKA